MYRKNIFGKKNFLFGEDSLTIFISKGSLRLSNTNVTDSILPSTFAIHELIKDTIIVDTVSSVSPEFKKAGKYVRMKLYPEKMLRPSEYHYTFYANYKGVKSKNLNLDINFIKVRQISLLNEYSFAWFGGKRGSMGLAFLGISWQPLSFTRLTISGAYPFFSSGKVKNNTDDKIAISDLSTRIGIEFFKSTEKTIYSYSIQMHRFPIINSKGEKSYDNIWGIGLKTSFPLLLFGSPISPVFSYNFFPNFSNKSYVSGIGIFEFTLGFRYNFLKRK